MLNSPFQSKKPEHLIPAECDVVFVADMFVEDLIGGAELTSEALIESSTFNVHKIHAKNVTMTTLELGCQKYWIFGNFSSLDNKLIPSIVANLRYSILEYDYKFCKYRSIVKHLEIEQKECDCHEQVYGKLMSAFFYGAKSLWFMSEAQQSLYFERFPFLDEHENWVLSSVFSEQFFVALKLLKEKQRLIEKSGWLVVGSTSWIKGTNAGIKWCEENNKEFKVIHNWPYERVLEELNQAEGLVYLPLGGDTCPRIVIEAKLLNCQLELNDNVQHKDEIWFNTDDPFDTEAYLYASREKFWHSIAHTMNWAPTISGYTTTKNCISSEYPWVQCIQSMLGFCNEVIVVDGGSTDGTWEELQSMKAAQEDDRLKVFQVERDWNHPRFAVYDGLQKAEARSRCTGDFCWQMDADEVVHENDYKKIMSLVKVFPSQVDLVSLPVIEYWGGEKKVRIDVNPWKWRLSKNLSHITHGIPSEFRKQDEDGNLYASPGTDGCDYINNETFERIPHASFYTQEIHSLRMNALNNDSASLNKYAQWFDALVESLPGVHHFSWFDIERKIKTYKNYWQQHWESLYNIRQEDTPENNMFFQKPWTDVSDDEIREMAKRLAAELGGWIFHTPVNFDTTVPYISPPHALPEVIAQNVEN